MYMETYFPYTFITGLLVPLGKIVTVNTNTNIRDGNKYLITRHFKDKTFFSSCIYGYALLIENE